MADALKMSVGSPWLVTATPGVTAFTLNQSTDQAEFILDSVANGSITRVGFRPSAKNGTATTWKISLQGGDGATGNPDGTVKGGGTPASATFTNAALTAGSWIWITLDNAYTIAYGESFSIVIAYDSGTAPSAGVNDVSVSMASGVTTGHGRPYYITNDNGTRVKSKSFINNLRKWNREAKAAGTVVRADKRGILVAAGSGGLQHRGWFGRGVRGRAQGTWRQRDCAAVRHHQGRPRAFSRYCRARNLPHSGCGEAAGRVRAAGAGWR